MSKHERDQSINGNSSNVRTADMGNFDDNPSYSHEWTSDSGATQHICGDLGWFGEYEEIHKKLEYSTIEFRFFETNFLEAVNIEQFQRMEKKWKFLVKCESS